MMKNEDLTLQQIQECLNDRRSFILEAGAGSGKTSSLVKSIQHILETKSATISNGKKIACITFTNVAKNEIISRIGYSDKVAVDTIHQFLWNNIEPYQLNLKKAIIEDNVDKIENLEDKIHNVSISYGEYGRNIEKGVLSHDDVITYSVKIFKKYNRLNKIISDKYPYIFVDEYQDTNPSIVEEILLQLNSTTLGFFGDCMQKIYNKGIGKIDDQKLAKITKLNNYRCSKKVVELLNKIRSDITQEVGEKNLEGSVSWFCLNKQTFNIHNFVKETSKEQGLDPKDYKVLMLTHGKLSKELGYENLLATYKGWSGQYGQDKLLQKKDPYSEFLGRIEEFIYLYNNKQYGSFLTVFGQKDFKIFKHSHKKALKNIIDTLQNKRVNNTIADVMNYVINENLLSKTKKMEEFESALNSEVDEDRKRRYNDFYGQLSNIQYSEYINFHNFTEENSPFSTKHGVKGKEYKNVVIVIDDSAWNQYNFNNFFKNCSTNIERYERTKNLFYVCCSRAENNLIIVGISDFPTQSRFYNKSDMRWSYNSESTNRGV